MSYAAMGGYAPGAPIPMGWRVSWPTGFPSSSSSSYAANVPGYFPQPPPMPTEYMYGKRAWSNGQWVVVPDQNASAVQGRQGRWWSNWGAKPSSQAYWDTKLTDNGLQLTNMDIRAPLPPEKPVAGAEGSHLRPRDENVANPNSRMSAVWVPALSDDSTTTSSTTTSRGARHQRSRSSSQPPQGRRPQSTEPPPPMPMPMGAQPGQSAEFISASSKARPGGSRRNQNIRTSQRDYIASQTGENAPFPPPNDDRQQQIPRYTSADGYRRKRTLSVSRSNQAANGAAQASQQSSRPVHGGRANGVQRSQTMPVEILHPQPHAPFIREPQFTVNGHGHKTADHYADPSEYTNGDYEPSRPLRTTFSPGIIRTPNHYDSPDHSPIRERYESVGEAHDGRKADRIREWIAKNEACTPQTRRTVDGTEHLSGSRSYDYIHSSGSKAGSGAQRDLQRHSSMPTTKSSSSTPMPTAIYAPPMQQQQSSSSSGAQMSDITEEPEDMAHGFARMKVGHGYGQAYGVRDESSLRSRSGSRRTTLERSSTMSSTAESEEYVARGSMSSRREYVPERYSSQRDDPPAPALSRRDSRSHHHTPASTSSPYVPRSHDGTPVRPDYMYSTPEKNPAHLYAPASSTPMKQSPLRHSEASSHSHRHSGSQSVPVPTTPGRQIYAYADGGAYASSPHTPVPQQQPQQQQQPVRRRSGHQDQLDVEYQRPPSRSPRTSRSPSPGPTRGMPASHPNTQPYSYVHTQQIYDTPTRQPPAYSSPAVHHVPAGHSSRAAVPGATSGTPTPSRRSSDRYIRYGYWNRRGDHLTDDGLFVVYCPPGRNFPKDLEGYPDVGYRDHLGNVKAFSGSDWPDELPDSIPKGGRPALRPYETFITYI